ncbi:MAG: thioredoxin family protein [Planctomycetes bacterium]|nr:thioredoxin family protein [Planctomycetota bacterium]
MHVTARTLAVSLAVSLVPVLAPATGQEPAQDASGGRPPVFVDLDFAAARARAQETHRLFVLDAMTSWCGPCKIMDRTTWRDAELTAWMDVHVVAIQLDMDVHTDVKQELAIRAFPTVVVFRDGQEVDRVVGTRDATFVRSWLGGLLEGRTQRDLLRGELLALAGDDRPGGWARRIELASELASLGEEQLATDTLAAAWEHGDGRPTEGLRTPMMRGAMRSLAERFAPARARFAALREAVAAAADAGTAADPLALRDWLDLNVVLGEAGRNIDWAGRIAELPQGAALLQRFADRLYQPLIDAGAWRAAGLALADPVRQLGERAASIESFVHHDAPAGAPTHARGDGPETAPEDASAPRVVPAIPLAPRAPTAPSEPRVIPAIPLAPRAPATPSAPRVVPAIPLAPRAPATPPAIPLAQSGGDRPAATGRGPRDPYQPRWDNPADPADSALEIQARIRYAFRQQAADAYAALLAAERGAEADEVAAALLRVDPSPRARAALVARALRAGVLDARSEAHQRWLDEAGG